MGARLTTVAATWLCRGRRGEPTAVYTCASNDVTSKLDGIVIVGHGWFWNGDIVSRCLKCDRD